MTESGTELANKSIQIKNKVELMKPFGAVFVMLEPSRWQYLITSLLNLLSGIINSDGATYLAAETYTTKVI